MLASASPRREALLRAAGIDFRVELPDADEEWPAGASPERGAEELARRKARSVAARVAEGVILGADTVVALGERVLGKPADADVARRMLRAISGTTHRVITGFALLDRPSEREVGGHEATWVTMRALSEEEIEGYVASREWEGKAGGYALQESADRFVVALRGSRSNVVGLPVERVLAAWTAWGGPGGERAVVGGSSPR